MDFAFDCCFLRAVPFSRIRMYFARSLVAGGEETAAEEEDDDRDEVVVVVVDEEE